MCIINSFVKLFGYHWSTTTRDTKHSQKGRIQFMQSDTGEVAYHVYMYRAGLSRNGIPLLFQRPSPSNSNVKFPVYCTGYSWHTPQFHRSRGNFQNNSFSLIIFITKFYVTSYPSIILSNIFNFMAKRLIQLRNKCASILVQKLPEAVRKIDIWGAKYMLWNTSAYIPRYLWYGGWKRKLCMLLLLGVCVSNFS